MVNRTLEEWSYNTIFRTESANHVRKDYTALVRGSIKKTLNELLEAKAEKLTLASRYELNEQCKVTEVSTYNHNLTTTSEVVTLKVPKLKGIAFGTSIIELYCRRESSVEKYCQELDLLTLPHEVQRWIFRNR